MVLIKCSEEVGFNSMDRAAPSAARHEFPSNSPSAMSANFESVFAELRAILARHVGSLSVTEDGPRRYCLEGGLHPKHRTPMPIAWVQIGKAYVSFHHMGVYACPDLLQGVSQELRARMQGKSCFNFTSVDPQLLAELEDLTVRGFERLRNAPFMQ